MKPTNPPTNEEIGSALIAVVMASAKAGHKKIRGTVTSYLPEDCTEDSALRFVLSVLHSAAGRGESAEEILNYWIRSK